MTNGIICNICLLLPVFVKQEEIRVSIWGGETLKDFEC